MISSSSPLSDGLTVEDEDLEECVHEEDPVWLDAGGVEQHRLGRTIEAVAVEDWLDHDETLGEVLLGQTASVESRLV